MLKQILIGLSIISLLLGVFFLNNNEQSQDKLELQKDLKTFNNLVWTKSEKLSEGLPSSIEVYETSSEVTTGIPFRGFYAKIDFSDENLDFKVQYGGDDKYMNTPEEYANMQDSEVYAVINGGFFDTTTGESQSLVVSEYVREARVLTNQDSYHYPTIGAFGMQTDRTFDNVYAYQVGEGVYSWQEPNPEIQEFPNQTFPPHGKEWDAVYGIGAGPNLIVNGSIVEGNPEYFSEYIMDQRHPRSAICRLENSQEVIFFVGDGRSDISTGLGIGELSHVMDQLGCIGAMNLDGGGSSCLFVNNQVANVPSDGHQRAVSTAIIVSQKQ